MAIYNPWKFPRFYCAKAAGKSKESRDNKADDETAKKYPLLFTIVRNESGSLTEAKELESEWQDTFEVFRKILLRLQLQSSL